MLQGEELAIFLRESWGREPRLFRQAIDITRYPLTGDELCEITGDELVESRLIAGDMSLTHGPFQQEHAEGNLLPENSMLLVQCIEQHLQVARDLLDKEFSFIPDWQVDDVMASFGYDNASCGAHFDKYDVFLVQHTGRKVWHLDHGNHREEDLDPEIEIRLLQTFEPTDSWVTEPGDVLYLPPGVGHHGVCEQASLTLSVGIRNPTMAELLADLSEFALLSLEENSTVNTQLFTGQEEIEDSVIQQLEASLSGVLDKQMLRRWFGAYATRLREPDLLEEQTTTRLRGGMALTVSLPTRIASSGTLMFVNGEVLEFDRSDREWIHTLSTRRNTVLPPGISKHALEALEALISNGALLIAEGVER